MIGPDEHTSGIEEAKKALAQSRARRRVTNRVVASAATTVSRLNTITEHPDVLADQLRAIIRGAA